MNCPVDWHVYEPIIKHPLYAQMYGGMRCALSETEKMLDNITMAICKGIFNEYTQGKMVELTNLKNDLIVKISEEERKTIKPLEVETIMNFFHKCVLAVECAEDPTSLEKRKRLFDSCIKEVIYEGEKFLIILKTTDMPESFEGGDEKETSRTECDKFRTRFGTLTFGTLKRNECELLKMNSWRYCYCNGRI